MSIQIKNVEVELGKTKSGKLIYNSFDNPMHAGFNDYDLFDAGKLFKQLAKNNESKFYDELENTGDFDKADIYRKKSYYFINEFLKFLNAEQNY